MCKTYIAAEKFAAYQEKQDDMDKMPIDEIMKSYPVDLNYACVAQEKDDPDNLEEAHELNLERFGLTEAGV